MIAAMKREDRRLISMLREKLSRDGTSCDIVERDMVDDDNEYLDRWIELYCDGDTIRVQRNLVKGRNQGPVKGFAVELWWSEDMTDTVDEDKRMLKERESMFVSSHGNTITACKKKGLDFSFEMPFR